MKILSGRLRFAGVVTAAIVLIFAFTACGDEEKKSDGALPAPAAGNGAATADACKLVTQEDASQLFGKPATLMTEGTQLDPTMVSSCNWTWDTDTQNQLLQFNIWNGEQFYDSYSTDVQKLELGDRGWIRVTGGVNIQWVQDDKTIDISYTTIDMSPGAREIPEASTKVEEVKALARKVEKEL